MDRVKCSVRDVSVDDRGMLVLLAEETLHPLADGAGHPERYDAAELLKLLERADVFVAEAEGEMAGFVAVEAEGDALAVRCVCVSRRRRRLTAFVPAGDHPSLHLYRGHDFVSAATPAQPAMLLLEKRLPAVGD